MGAFVNGSWQFPYLLVVPVNSILSAIILYSMVTYLDFILVVVWESNFAVLSGNVVLALHSVVVKQETSLDPIQSLQEG